MISKGYLYDIVSVKNLESEAPPLELVPIVKDIPEVFPDYLLAIPPEPKIDFGIDLISDTKPIQIPPYKMAPSELNELMSQLMVFLHKGFIQQG